MSKNPLVSIIVPTKNSSNFLDACLRSIQEQSYRNVELIVVDNDSADSTKTIAQKYTSKVYNRGPERSAQRNFGAKKAKGSYLLFIDSDMKLSKNVVLDCVNTIRESTSVGGIIIPEESFGEGFWAQCKKLERSFYVGIDGIEAARFFSVDLYRKIGGYDESLISGEDWDLSQRMGELAKIYRIPSLIFHNEGRLRLLRTLRKKYYYAQKFSAYTAKHKASSTDESQTSVAARYKLYFAKPSILFNNPLCGFGMLFMKTLEFGVGAAGMLIGIHKSKERRK